MIGKFRRPHSRPQGAAAAGASVSASDARSFRILLWVCCGLIDVLLVAGLIWWLSH